MMKSIFKPKPDINYNVIALLYGIGSVLSLFFLCLEKYLGSERMKDYELVKENIEYIEGIYVIFCPFIPCLFWSLIVRAKAMNGVVSEKSKSD